MKYDIGQQVRYIPGYRGYFAATSYIIEFSSGLQPQRVGRRLEAL